MGRGGNEEMQQNTQKYLLLNGRKSQWETTLIEDCGRIEIQNQKGIVEKCIGSKGSNKNGSCPCA